MTKTRLEQVRDALVACADAAPSGHERAAFLNLSRTLTTPMATKLRAMIR